MFLIRARWANFFELKVKSLRFQSTIGDWNPKPTQKWQWIWVLAVVATLSSFGKVRPHFVLFLWLVSSTNKLWRFSGRHSCTLWMTVRFSSQRNTQINYIVSALIYNFENKKRLFQKFSVGEVWEVEAKERALTVWKVELLEQLIIFISIENYLFKTFYWQKTFKVK